MLISSVNYPDIRAAIDIGLTDDILPDAVIALDVYVGAAERDVVSRDPFAETRTGAARVRVQAATVLFTAALLAPAIPQFTSEKLADYSYNRQTFDWHKLAAELRSRAVAEINQVIGATGQTVYDRPTMFTKVSGRRG